MKDLAIHLRMMQLFAHNQHNLCSRIVFMQDHEFFGDLYSTYEGSYDDIIERIIGLYGDEQLDLNAIQTSAVQKLSSAPSKFSSNSESLSQILSMEKHLCELITELSPKLTIGTQNLVADMADKSEVRQYKIKQRIKK